MNRTFHFGLGHAINSKTGYSAFNFLQKKFAVSQFATFIFLVLMCAFCNIANAQFSNITISSTRSTTGGAWAGASTQTFTPSATTAVIGISDLQTRLASSNVIIAGNTNVGGANPGNIVDSGTITVSNATSTSNTLTITSGTTSGNIIIITGAAINLAVTGTPASVSSNPGTAGFPGDSLVLNAAGSILDSGAITTTGGAGGPTSSSTGIGGKGGTAGAVKISGASAVVIAAAITANGGTAGASNQNNGAICSSGGQASGVTLQSSAGNVVVTAAINANGAQGGSHSGANAAGGVGGVAGFINISGNNDVSGVSAVTIKQTLSAIAGNAGTSTNTATNSAAGAGPSASSTPGITLTSAAGSITINTAGSLSTTGGSAVNPAGSTGTGSVFAGGNAGPVNITAATGITITQGISTVGGVGETNVGSGAGGNGGNGGNITLSGANTNGINLANTSNTFSTTGGAGGAMGNSSAVLAGSGGVGGAIRITATSGAITINQTLQTKGGLGGTPSGGGVGGAGGNSGNININGQGGVTINSSAVFTPTGGSAGGSLGNNAGGNAGNTGIDSIESDGAKDTINISLSANGVAGGNANGSSAKAGGLPGAAGNIVIIGNSGIVIGANQTLTADGKAPGNSVGGNAGVNCSSTVGNGGTITLLSASGAIVTSGTTSAISAAGSGGGTSGGNFAGGNGALGGTININGATGVNILATLATSGGNGTNAGGSASNNGGSGGNGGPINITGAAGITVTKTITSNGGTGGTKASSGSNGTVGAAGNFTFNDGAASATNSGNGTGANDGVSGIISGSQCVTCTGSNLSQIGSGALKIAAANTYSDSTIVSGGGTLLLGVGLAIPSGSKIRLSGTSTLDDGGFGDSTLGTLTITGNPIINLGTAGTNRLRFVSDSLTSWTGATLTINNWSGTAGTGGTAGRIFFGTTSAALSGTQLGLISFNGFPGVNATELSTGEIVPTNINPSVAISGPTTQAPTAIIASPSTSDTAYKFTATVTVATATLTDLSFTSTGTATPSNITDFKLYASTSLSSPGTAIAMLTNLTGFNSTSISFPAFSQSLTVGTWFFWIVADVASGVTNVSGAPPTFTISGIASSNLTVSSPGMVSGSTLSNGNTQTISSTVTIANLPGGQPPVSIISTPSSDDSLYRFSIAPTVSSTTLTGLTFTTAAGGAAATGTEIADFKLYAATTNSWSTAFGNGSIASAAGAGPGSHTFGTLSTSLTAGTTYYFWITADINSGVTGNKTITVSALANSNFTVSLGTVTGGNLSAGNTQTISSAPIVTAVSAGSITATSAVLSATVNPNGSPSTTNTFDYGIDPSFTNVASGATPSTNGTITSTQTTTLNLPSLQSNTQYDFEVNATNSNGTTTVQNNFITPPAQVMGLTAGTATTLGFTVSWVAPANSGSSYTYLVIASTTSTFNAGTTTSSASLPFGTITYTFSSSTVPLVPSTTYYYEVEVISTLTGAQTATLASTSSNSPTTVTTLTAAGSACGAATISSTSTRPVIDGSVDAIWSQAPVNTISSSNFFNKGSNPTQPPDESGSTWQAMYTTTGTNDSLYLLVHVNDNILESNLSNSSYFQDDQVELFVNSGTARTGSLNYTSTNVKASQIQFRYNDPTPHLGSNTSGVGISTSGVRMASPAVTGGYNVEAVIPLSDLAISSPVTNGATIGFDINIDDDDLYNTGTSTYGTGSEARNGTIGWFTTSGNDFTTPSNFGTATFSNTCSMPVLSNPVATSITAISATLVDTVTATSGGTLKANGAGTQYSSVSSTLANGTALPFSGTPVVGTAFSTPTVSNLLPQTLYYYQGYAATNFGVGVSPIKTFYTLSNAPTVNAAFTSASGCNSSAIVNWSTATFPSSGATAKGYVLLRALSPNTPSLGNSTGAGPRAGTNTTLLSFALLSSDVTYTDNSVSAGNTYNYLLVPFTWNGTDSATFNYLTGGIVQSVAVVSGYTWKGGGTSSFTDVNNWTSCGVAPSGSDITVQNGASPMPQLAGNFAVGNLILQGSSTFDINGHTLTLNGSLTGTGTLTGSSTSNLTIGGAAGSLKFTSGAQVLDNLVLNASSSASLGTALGITAGASAGTLTVNTGATLTTGGNLTIKSDTLGTASVAASAGTISGNVTVERAIPANTSRAWRLLSVPTKTSQTIQAAWQEGATSEGSNPVPKYGTIITAGHTNAGWATEGFDTVQTDASMLTWDQAASKWDDVTTTNGTPPTNNPIGGKIDTTSGYFLYIRGDRTVLPSGSSSNQGPTTLRTIGPLYQGTQPGITVTTAGDAFGLIGNIYASAINFTQLSFGSGIDSVFYVWDPKLLLSGSLGQYQTLSASFHWKPVPGGGSYAIGVPNTRIESGQAFFVHSNSNSNNTIALTEGAKVAGSNNVFRPEGTPDENASFETQLYESSNGSNSLSDENVAVFDNNYANAVDGADALKLSNTAENFSLARSGRILEIEARQPVGASDTLFYYMWNMKKQGYQLQFAPSNLNTGLLTAYLVDNYLGSKTAIDLSSASTVNFSIDGNAASAATNRFMVVFSGSTPVPVVYTSIKAWQQNSGITVSWKVANQTGISSYVVEKSTDGKTFTAIATVKATGQLSYSSVDNSPSPGNNYYRVLSTAGNGQVLYSQVVNVSLSAESSIAIYPNPVTQGYVNIELRNQPAGSYEVRLIDMAGQVLSKTVISHAGGSSAQSVNVPPSLAQGIYRLEVAGPAKSVFAQKIFIK